MYILRITLVLSSDFLTTILSIKSFDNFSMSARAYDKVLRLARTIADLADSEEIKLEHIAEALQFRALDRKYWEV